MTIINISFDISKYPSTKRTSKLQIKKGTGYFAIDKEIVEGLKLTQGMEIHYRYVPGPNGRPSIYVTLDGRDVQDETHTKGR